MPPEGARHADQVIPPFRLSRTSAAKEVATSSRTSRGGGISRRSYPSRSAAATATFTIVPRHVLGGLGQTPPSEEVRGADRLRRPGVRSFRNLGPGMKQVAQCDVRFKDKADDKEFYTDCRRVLQRDDIDVVRVATHPGWHALISIAAMESGKDVVCEKPMCRFISEGRAVAEAEKRYGRIFQIEGKGDVRTTARKIFAHGLLERCDSVLITGGGFKLRQWSGRATYPAQPVPANPAGTCTAAPLPCGRPLKFDPVTEQIAGDEEANSLVNQPMRSPWRL